MKPDIKTKYEYRSRTLHILHSLHCSFSKVNGNSLTFEEGQLLFFFW